MTPDSTGASRRVLFISDIDARDVLPGGLGFAQTTRKLGRNSGNLLFTHAIQTFIERTGTPYDVVSPPRSNDLTVDWSKYSHCVVNVANWLAKGLKDYLSGFARNLRDVGIPVFCVGIGAQANKGEDPDFILKFQREASEFFDAVLGSGGAIGLRGAFTAECLDRLGYSGTYTVTGCPSMFQFHRELAIEKPALERSEFKPLLNGTKQLRDTRLIRDFRTYRGAQYICQDVLMEYLAFYDQMGSKQQMNLLHWPDEALELIRDGQARIFFTLSEWIDFIRYSGFNYSYGARVHGNIAAILAGVPATVTVIDSRTSELADFFCIPTSEKQNFDETHQLFHEYEKADFSAFNTRFPTTRDNFLNFIDRSGIPFALPTAEESGKLAFLDRLNAVSDTHLDADAVDPEMAKMIDDYVTFRPIGLLTNFLEKRRQFAIRRLVMSGA